MDIAYETNRRFWKVEKRRQQPDQESWPQKWQSDFFCLIYHDVKLKKLEMEKREPLYTVGGNVNWYSHYGKQYGGFSKN